MWHLHNYLTNQRYESGKQKFSEKEKVEIIAACFVVGGLIPADEFDDAVDNMKGNLNRNRKAFVAGKSRKKSGSKRAQRKRK